MARLIECFVCDETRMVCEIHPERPSSGKYACGCGADAIPCTTCIAPVAAVQPRPAALEKIALVVLTVLAVATLSLFSDRASADQLKPRATDVSSRQRCVCSTMSRPTRVARYRHYRIRSAYLIGYDVLPYRFGSTYVWEPPYRYYRGPPW